MIALAKVCSRCRTLKPAADYWLRQNRLQSACKACMRDRVRELRRGAALETHREPTPIEQAELWAAFRSWRLRGCVPVLRPNFGMVCEVRYRPTTSGYALLRRAA